MKLKKQDARSGGGGMKPLVVTLQLDVSPALVAMAMQLIEALTRAQPLAPTPPEPTDRDWRWNDAPPSPPIEPQPQLEPEPDPDETNQTPAPGGKQPPQATLPPTGRKWTPQRVALLTHHWPTGLSRPDVLAALLELPGPAMTLHQVSNQATNLGLKRPKAVGSSAPEPTASPPVAVASIVPAEPLDAQSPASAAQGQTPAAAPSNVQKCDYATAHAWAAQRGLAPAREGMDLVLVNRKRIQLGLPAFELLPRRIGRQHQPTSADDRGADA